MTIDQVHERNSTNANVMSIRGLILNIFRTLFFFFHERGQQCWWVILCDVGLLFLMRLLLKKLATRFKYCWSYFYALWHRSAVSFRLFILIFGHVVFLFPSLFSFSPSFLLNFSDKTFYFEFLWPIRENAIKLLFTHLTSPFIPRNLLRCLGYNLIIHDSVFTKPINRIIDGSSATGKVLSIWTRSKRSTNVPIANFVMTLFSSHQFLDWAYLLIFAPAEFRKRFIVNIIAV